MPLGDARGRVAWIFGEENFDVDRIVGISNIKITDVEQLARVAMSEFDPEFARKIIPGDWLVGGENFGYGHPHYPPMKAMRHLGIQGVIANSFSPGFWRGEVAMGFPLVPCPGIAGAVERWQTLSVSWERGVVTNLDSGLELEMDPISLADGRMMETGGLIPYLKASLAEENRD